MQFTRNVFWKQVKCCTSRQDAGIILGHCLLAFLLVFGGYYEEISLCLAEMCKAKSLQKLVYWFAGIHQFLVTVDRKQTWPGRFLSKFLSKRKTQRSFCLAGNEGSVVDPGGIYGFHGTPSWTLNKISK